MIKYDISKPLYKIASIVRSAGFVGSGFSLGRIVSDIVIKDRVRLPEIIGFAVSSLAAGGSAYYTHRCKKEFDRKLEELAKHYPHN